MTISVEDLCSHWDCYYKYRRVSNEGPTCTEGLTCTADRWWDVDPNLGRVVTSGRFGCPNPAVVVKHISCDEELLTMRLCKECFLAEEEAFINWIKELYRLGDDHRINKGEKTLESFAQVCNELGYFTVSGLKKLLRT